MINRFLEKQGCDTPGLKTLASLALILSAAAFCVLAFIVLLLFTFAPVVASVLFGLPLLLFIYFTVLHKEPVCCMCHEKISKNFHIRYLKDGKICHSWCEYLAE